VGHSQQFATAGFDVSVRVVSALPTLGPTSAPAPAIKVWVIQSLKFVGFAGFYELVAADAVLVVDDRFLASESRPGVVFAAEIFGRIVQILHFVFLCADVV